MLFEVTQQVAPCMAVNITVNQGGHCAIPIPASHPSMAKLWLVVINPMGDHRYTAAVYEDILLPSDYNKAYLDHRKGFILLQCFHGRWVWPAAFVVVYPA